jgi:hypothetical protein
MTSASLLIVLIVGTAVGALTGLAAGGFSLGALRFSRGSSARQSARR